MTRRQLTVLEKNLPKLLARAAGGENLDKPIAYHHRMIATMQRRLAD